MGRRRRGRWGWGWLQGWGRVGGAADRGTKAEPKEGSSSSGSSLCPSIRATRLLCAEGGGVGLPGMDLEGSAGSDASGEVAAGAVAARTHVTYFGGSPEKTPER